MTRTTGLDIPAAGCVSMSGDEALAYVRSRHYEYMDDGWHTDPTSDYGRIARQQDFIRRALQKAIDKGARNPGVARTSSTWPSPTSWWTRTSRSTTSCASPRPCATSIRRSCGPTATGSTVMVGVQGGESVIIPDLNAPTTKAVLEFFRGQAQLTDVAPPDATAATDPGATTTAPATTTTPTTAAAPTTTRRQGATTTAPAAGATTTAPAAGATTTVPVIDVAPNPLGIAPPDDPSCR